MGTLDSHNTTTEPIDYSALVQAEQGLVSRRISRSGHLSAGAGAGVRTLLALPVS